MRRIAVVGPPGSGKSTLARRIGTALGLEVIHLDRYFWRPGWVESPRDEFAAIHQSLIRSDAWVIDGNYGATMDDRFTAADTIIYLDEGSACCTWRIVARMWRTRGSARPDLNEGCVERLTWDFGPFVWYTMTFNRRKRPLILAAIERYRDGARTVVVLQGRHGADDFAATMGRPMVPRGEG
ncbi:MAG TPA: AAA family ATPase [Armatimonadota bacterium]|jgi:adenylate kinase family enzyme